MGSDVNSEHHEKDNSITYYGDLQQDHQPIDQEEDESTIDGEEQEQRILEEQDAWMQNKQDGPLQKQWDSTSRPPCTDNLLKFEMNPYQMQHADMLVNKHMVDKSNIKMLKENLAAAHAQADSLKQLNISVLSKEIHCYHMLCQWFESTVDEEVQKRLEFLHGKQAEII
ncbi:hypothetical protein BT96DRAFT_948862 [Gymnopus androsaceus JB14]|uniref:Uncharacterized protein n=1 Tax=Gymnopus androsaceus JB14 TaxID=1447944 RepID=A0A6A4GN47_9AGAR|nr:hypothetical protein BT96DRAFT_948862 [Gymnopus androsaceus JB14]